MESVSDAEAWAAMKLVAKTDGMSVEPAAAVAFAGLQKMVANEPVSAANHWLAGMSWWWSTAPGILSRWKSTSWAIS